MLRPSVLAAALALAACARVEPETAPQPAAPMVAPAAIAESLVYPRPFQAAIREDTRTTTGVPGRDYWQQWTDYRITARLFPERKRLEGAATLVYHNNSPDTLRFLLLELTQNIHREGVVRNEPAELTGGVVLDRVVVGGVPLTAGPIQGGTRSPTYEERGTRLAIVPPAPVLPGDSAVLAFEWHFTVPQAGASGRMGYDADNLYFLAYWYPRMAVYDDVVGWHADPFLGTAEFYQGWGNYEYTVEAPEGWVVVGTGELVNAEQVLAPAVLQRLRIAERSDTTVAVIGERDLARPATARGGTGRLRWRFVADSVRDVAFSATTSSVWEAARAAVGDRDGDGDVDYTRVDAIYRPDAGRWRNAVRYGVHAINFLSEYTGIPYPYSHMTSVEARQIIGGGMEYPMMTLIGDYTARGDTALYGVIVHEFAHMWVPMLVGTDERRYGWMDEGLTEFAERKGETAYYPGIDWFREEQETYLQAARAGIEGEILRWSDFHYNPFAYGVASYYKPATLLHAMGAVLGDSTFLRAYREFLATWKYRHPYPWDMFNTFERVSGRDLDWFWVNWYQTTSTLDQAIVRVEPSGQGTRIVVANQDRVPMPVFLEITREGGERIRREIPVEAFLGGAREATVEIPAGAAVTRVEIDPDRRFPDIDRADNVWTR